MWLARQRLRRSTLPQSVVAVQRRAVGSDTADGAHFALLKFSHVGVVDLVQRRDTHLFRHKVAQSGEIGVPLAGQLLGITASVSWPFTA